MPPLIPLVAAAADGFAMAVAAGIAVAVPAYLLCLVLI